MLLLCSCNVQKQSDVERIFLENAKTCTPSDVFDSLEIIPLELNENTYFKGVKNISFDGKRYIICDNRNILYVFSPKGKFIASSEKKLGNGRGEYSVVTAFSYNIFSELIEIATPAGILFYDCRFNLKKFIKLSNVFDTKDKPKFVRSINDLSNNEHLLFSDSELDTKHEAYIFDSNNNSIKKQINIEDETCVPITMQSSLLFNYKDENTMFYPPLSSNYIYTFNVDKYSFTKRFFIDFGKNGLSKEEIDKSRTNKEKLSELLLTTEQLIPIKCMATENKIFIVAKKSDKVKNWFTFCVNTQNNSVCAIPHTNEESLRMFPIYSTVFDNTVLAIVAASEAKEYIKNYYGNKYSKIDDMEDETMVILKYKIK